MKKPDPDVADWGGGDFLGGGLFATCLGLDCFSNSAIRF
jgi:hypothetical protein